MPAYHLYYHDDLDGTASGAVFYDFLKKRGDDIVSFTPLDYGIHHDSSWETFEFQSPFVLVDFQYHPKADWWVDHHASAFANPELKENFVADAKHHWDPKAPSACGLVADFLEKKHDYKLTDRARELVRIVDIDDSAGYPSLHDAIELDSAYKKIQLLLGDTEIKKDREKYLLFREFLIKNYLTIGMDAIVAMPEYKGRIDFLINERKKANDLIKDKAVLNGRVIFTDTAEHTTRASRWAVYEKFLEAPYSLQVLDKSGEFKVGIGSNKWSKIKPDQNLGAIAEKYGGGGHFGVGAIYVKTKAEAEKIAGEIMQTLND